MSQTDDLLWAKIEEIKTKYNVSEAETACLVQMLAAVRLNGFSAALTLKLLKILVELLETLTKAAEEEKKKTEN